MKYKAGCLICKENFGFKKEDIKIDCEINNRAIEMKAYVNCPNCGLKLTVAKAEIQTVLLEEYTDNN